MTNLRSEISTLNFYKQKQKYKNNQKNRIFAIYFLTLRKKQINDDEIFQTTCFTRLSRPSVKELQLLVTAYCSVDYSLLYPMRFSHDLVVVQLLQEC